MTRLQLALVVLIPLAHAGCGSEAPRASVPTAPSTPTPPTPAPGPITTVTVEFGGRVVDADAGGPVANARVSVSGWGHPGPPRSGEQVVYDFSNEIATSGADGTFTLPLNLPSDWTSVGFQFTGPAGYDVTYGSFKPTADIGCVAWQSCWAAADRPAMRMYPTLVIKPDESIKVRVTDVIFFCGAPWSTTPCRRVLVAAPPGDLVALEVVPDDSSQPMAVKLSSESFEFDGSVRRVMVEPGGFAYVWAVFEGGGNHGGATATLTARR
jgi:hypothetical protein